MAAQAETGRGFDALAGAPGFDPAPGEQDPAGLVVVALVTVQFRGPLAGPSDRLFHRLEPSTTSWSMVLSLTLAADTTTCSGSPCRSLTAWILEPGLPRSTGLGPIRSPL